MGSSGTYELTISVDGAFFQKPLQRFYDAISQAAGSRAGWIYSVAATWSCQVGDSCQDVYDIPLQSGSSLTLQATEVTGNSVARLAAYAPGSPLSGTNLLTGGSLDYSCNGQDTNELAPPVSISSSGIHRIAFARDWGSSSGSSGSYRGSIIVTDGYGGNVIQSAQDTESSSSGFTCPP